jgi:processive 1,2-diacylglycerol beta-glucosyltransferase
MHLLTQVSDVIVTRGGTTTCAKALHCGTPILLNGIGGVMPQERLTAKFFLQDRAARMVARPEDLRRILREWRDDPSSYHAMRQRMLAMQYQDDPALVVRELIDLAREAAAAWETRGEGAVPPPAPATAPV